MNTKLASTTILLILAIAFPATTHAFGKKDEQQSQFEATVLRNQADMKSDLENAQSSIDGLAGRIEENSFHVKTMIEKVDALEERVNEMYKSLADSTDAGRTETAEALKVITEELAAIKAALNMPEKAPANEKEADKGAEN